MPSFLSEIRRLFALLGLLFAGLSIVGTDFPWTIVSEGDANHSGTRDSDGGKHYWYFVDSDEDITALTPVYKTTYLMHIHMGLLNAESCQEFVAGHLPASAGGGALNGLTLCATVSFADLNSKSTKLGIITHEWEGYATQCQDSGRAAFGLMLLSILILIMTVAVTTVKSIRKKCCPYAFTSATAASHKWILPCIASLSPLFSFIAVLVYYAECINGSSSDTVDKQFTRFAKGETGFWFACASIVFLLIWWILFTIWFCRKTVNDAANVSFSNRQSNSAMSSNSGQRKKKKKKKKKDSHEMLEDDSQSDEDDDDHNHNHNHVTRTEMTPKNNSVAKTTPFDENASPAAGAYADNRWQDSD